MKKNIYKKMLVWSTVLLFIGVAVVPTINAENKKIDQTLNDTYQTQSFNKDPTYELLIITPTKFKKELMPLVAHKEKIGVSTYIITLSEIYEEMYWQGRDDAEKIKYFIKTAIEEWGIEYVLLVGGKKGQFPSWYLPVRYVNMENILESHYISDLYYADIYDAEGNFSSWDSDGDGLYGEWFYGKEPEDKDIDLNPDVAVGRLPCRNKIEVKIMVNKIINYETNAYGQTWFYDMLVFAGDTMPKYKSQYLVEFSSLRSKNAYEGEYFGDLAIGNMKSFNTYRFYTSNGTFRRQSDVIKAFSKGSGFVYFVGHGSPQMWGTYAPYGERFIIGLTVWSVHKLRNRHKLPIVVLSGCHCLQFDVSIFKKFNKTTREHMEGTLECLGWRLTRKIGGGSIATIGQTGLGCIREDKESRMGGVNELEVEFFKQYGQNNIDILGDTWTAAIKWYVNTYPVHWNTQVDNDSWRAISDSWIDAQVVESWALFGDPSLKIGGYE